MPKYILHTVQKEDTLWGISKKYKVEEHKIVQANPDKIKLQKRGSKYTPVIYEGDVLRIPQDTEETNSYKIEGKASLGMGESTEYQLLDSEGDIPHYPSGKISWQFHVDEGSENWRQLRLEKEKTGQKFTIVFTNQKLKSKKIRIEAYFKGQDGSQKLVEFLMVLDGEDIPEIKKLELLDANRNLIKRKLSYAETLFARAQCTGMEGETLYFSLWEDDAPGAGHSKENEENFIATKPAQVVNGRAEVSFSLIYSTMAPIANRKIPAGQKDEGPYHEYYVTVTRYEATEPEKSSKNVDVNNPDYVPLPPKPKPKKKETPKTQPQAQPKKKEPQVIHKDKVNAPAKPPASAWKEPKIIKVYIRDTQGKVWTRRPKYGEKIWVMVESQNLIDKKIKLKLYDKDKFSNDLLYEEDRYISQNLNRITVTLTKEMQDKGGDVWYQNIFAEVSLYDTKQTVKSEVIDVDKTDFSLPKPEGINPVTKKAPEQKGEDKDCGQKYCIKKGDKSELIREINIRLAGFGGNVPTDEFTDRTEKMIKQFQRDYMKVPETGRICGNVLKAIDEFSSIWKENIKDYTCLCKNENSIKDKCSGFGKGRYKGVYTKTKTEKHHKYERPGMHRSLLWGVSALKYYLSLQKVYKYNNISAGYRCWEHNDLKKRKTTNHMGKAVDIQFKKNGKAITDKLKSNLNILEEIRDKFFSKYLSSKYNWVNGYNNFSLEPFGLNLGQTWSWIHMDVREFDNKYLDDKYFTKSQSSLEGKKIIALAQEFGFINTCNCLGTSNIEKKKEETKDDRVDPKTLKATDKIKEFIESFEGFKPKPYNDTEGYATIGIGYLIAYKSKEKVTKEDVAKTEITWEEYTKGLSKSKALAIFNKKITLYEKSIYRDVTVPLYQHEFDALVSLLFNCGPDFFKYNKAPKLYKNLLLKNYEVAASEFLDITNQGTSGLVNRRIKENKIFLHNIYENNQ